MLKYRAYAVFLFFLCLLLSTNAHLRSIYIHLWLGLWIQNNFSYPLDAGRGLPCALWVLLPKKNYNYKTARKTSNFPCGYLLFANLNSTVQMYAYEFKLTKYNFLFRSLTV